VTGEAAGGQRARPGARKWMTAEDEFQALLKIKAWYADHPESSDPRAGIAALGLPDMTGVPQDKRARNRTQQRMAAEAVSMLKYAEYVIRTRDGIKHQSGAES
jgi:hypothetical protein